MSDPVRKALRLLMGSGVLLFLLCGWFGYRALARVARNEASARRSEAVQAGLESLLSAMKDVETGQRGFVITGREQYLEPYAWGLGKVGPTLDNVSKLVAENPAQTELVGQIRQAIEAKTTVVRQTIEIRRNSGEAAARDLVLSDRGKYAMDRLRILVAQAQQAESVDVERREAESAKGQRTVVATFALVLLAGFGLLVLIYITITRNLRSSETSARELRRSEEQYRQTAAELQVISDRVPALLSYLDSEGRFVRANQVYERWLCTNQENILGRCLGTS